MAELGRRMDSRQREERINLLGNDLMLAQCLSILAVELLTLTLYLTRTEYWPAPLILQSYPAYTPTSTGENQQLRARQELGQLRHTVCAVSSKTILKLINRVGLYSAAICSLQQQTETRGIKTPCLHSIMACKYRDSQQCIFSLISLFYDCLA